MNFPTLTFIHISRTRHWFPSVVVSLKSHPRVTANLIKESLLYPMKFVPLLLQWTYLAMLIIIILLLNCMCVCVNAHTHAYLCLSSIGPIIYWIFSAWYLTLTILEKDPVFYYGWKTRHLVDCYKLCLW